MPGIMTNLVDKITLLIAAIELDRCELSTSNMGTYLCLDMSVERAEAIIESLRFTVDDVKKKQGEVHV